MLTINLLQALPKTPLWDRLEKAGRLHDDPQRESKESSSGGPFDEVVAIWRRVRSLLANDPGAIVRVPSSYQIDATYASRAAHSRRRAEISGLPKVRRGAVLAYNVFVQAGFKSDYRRHFWRAARHALRRGQIDAVLSIGFMTHHLIQFTREALRDEQICVILFRQRPRPPSPRKPHSKTRRRRCANRPAHPRRRYQALAWQGDTQKQVSQSPVRHCERSEAIQGPQYGPSGLLRACTCCGP